MFPDKEQKQQKQVPKEAAVEDAEENTEIPIGVESKMEMFIKSLNSTKMNPKQRAVVLNKLIDMLNLDGAPFNWKREMISKIKN